MSQTITSFLTCFIYCASTLAQTLHLGGKQRFPKPVLIITGLFGAALHGYLLYRWIDTPFGQNLSASHMLSLVCWLMLVLILISAIYQPVENLSIFILPVAAASIPLALAFPGNEYLQTRLYPLRLTHILISIAALAVLGMAALQAILLYLQTHWIRHKSSEGALRFLPPLQTMETLLFQIIWLGFLFLSASLASACIFLDDIFIISRLQKILFSFLAWAFFATLLYGHYRSGWRGTTAIRWTLSGMVLLIVAYFSSKLIALKYGLKYMEGLNIFG